MLQYQMFYYKQFELYFTLLYLIVSPKIMTLNHKSFVTVTLLPKIPGNMMNFLKLAVNVIYDATKLLYVLKVSPF